MSTSEKYRHDWYQTEAAVVVTILAKNVDDKTLKVKVEPHKLDVRFKIPNKEEEQSFVIILAHEVNTDIVSHKVYQSKIEVKLKKVEGIRWTELEGKEEVLPPSDEPPKYPSSSLKQKDWDKVATTIDDDQPEGEAALNALFSKIYSEGSDEVRKAMNKSFTESGGTVLSTNWDDVRKDKVNVQPPQGMEFKKWDN